MFARFVLPVTPLLLLAAEALIGRLPGFAVQWVACLIVVGGIGFAVFPRRARAPGQPHRIVEERHFYPKERIADARRVGEELARALEGTEPRVAIYGSQAMLAYYARFPVVIEAHTG